MEMSPTSQVEKFSGWDSLSATDRATVTSFVTNNASALEGTKVDLKEDKKLLQDSTSKSGNKRKRTFESDQKLENSKDAGNCSSIKLPSENNVKIVEGEPSKGSVLESQLEDQTKTLWALKDDLKKHVTSSKMREMLEVNDQDSRGSKLDLRERCADGMIFGALSKFHLKSDLSIIDKVKLPHLLRWVDYIQVNMLLERNKSYGAIKFVDISSDTYRPEDIQGLDYKTMASYIK